MKKTILFAALGVVFGAALAFGQNSLKFKVDIPFDFHVGGIHMPADQYEIVAGYTPLGGMMFRMRAYDLSTIALITPELRLPKRQISPSWSSGVMGMTISSPRFTKNRALQRT